MVMVRYETCPRCTNACMITYTVEFGKILSIKNAACPKGENFIYEQAETPDSIINTKVYVKNGTTSLAEVQTSKPVPGYLLNEMKNALKKLELEAPLEFGQVLATNYLNSGADLISRSKIEKYK